MSTKQYQHDEVAGSGERLPVLFGEPEVLADREAARVVVAHRGRLMELTALDAVLVAQALLEAAAEVLPPVGVPQSFLNRPSSAP